MSVVKSTYAMNIGGVNVTSNFAPILINLTVTDKVGTHSDTASITVDDTGGRVAMPRIGDKVQISLGSSGGASEVFRGVVDEVKAQGSRSGRTVTVTAKGVDTTKRAKEPQQRHFDDQTIQGALSAAAGDADISSVEIKGGLGGLKRKFMEMRDESFIHFGERLAREIGGNFKIVDDKAIMTPRDQGGAGSVAAVWGGNLHSYDISPKLGRPQFKETKSRYYDKDEAKWKDEKVATKIKDAAATLVSRFALADKDESKQQSDSNKATTERDAGEGSVTIELNPSAKPDGTCSVSVGKSGVDGSYKIDTVKHSISRGSGGTTTLELKQPET